MGAPMAGHLLAAGREVTVWNRTPEKCEPLKRQGAAVAPNLGSLGAYCDLVLICVNRTEDVRAVLADLLPTARPGLLVVDHSTIAPSAAQELHAELKAKGHRFVDAPITGGSMGAQKGTLTIFCGGDASDVEAAQPFLAAYGKTMEHVGPAGQGQMMKMANQIAVGGALLGLCECLAFADRAGLNLEQAHRLISGGAGGSWAFDNYGPKALASDWTPGFSIKNQRKDFGYCQEAAAQAEVDLPGTTLVDALLAKLEAEGRGEEATVALLDLLRRARS